MIINYVTITYSVYALINTISFVVMIMDKRSSVSNSDRTPEGVLFFLASIFGSLGIILGMYIIRHKNRKWYFVIGMPLMLLQNMAFLWLVFNFS